MVKVSFATGNSKHQVQRIQHNLWQVSCDVTLKAKKTYKYIVMVASQITFSATHVRNEENLEDINTKL